MPKKTGSLYARGLVCQNPEEVITRKLDVYNASSSMLLGTMPGRGIGARHMPPGVFFYFNMKSAAEGWARAKAETEKKLACAIQLNITPENFFLLEGRVWKVERETDRTGRSLTGIIGALNYSYPDVKSFSDLPRGEIAVRFHGLTNEQLRALNPLIGFLDESNTFLYEPFSELSHRLLAEGKITQEQQHNLNRKEFF